MTWSQICGAYVPPGPRKDSALKKTHSILFDGPAAAPAPIAGPPALRRGLTAMDARQLGTAEEDLDDFGFEDMIPPAPPPEKKLRLSAAADIAATASGKKSVCPYGQRCYRKNPAHFLEFEHPWRDEDSHFLPRHAPERTRTQRGLIAFDSRLIAFPWASLGHPLEASLGLKGPK
ncbi:unnamed protein product [Effrenium voratum]|nr:unnamed protein product [Effrenium voratum]CAJ1454058.1 unnamed protein product [Effrenium voratum]